jgi:hypothetical protein
MKGIVCFVAQPVMEDAHIVLLTNISMAAVLVNAFFVEVPPLDHVPTALTVSMRNEWYCY